MGCRKEHNECLLLESKTKIYTREEYFTLFVISYKTWCGMKKIRTKENK